ncbi:MAG: hypothetical protein IT381_24660 [Deltaproteobacteria bacterium]|nr:hypothetical protein [Deltaproteobacteria bacterium]
MIALFLTVEPQAAVRLESAPRLFSVVARPSPFWMLTQGSLARPERPLLTPEVTSAFNMYAEAGGLQLGPGLRTAAFVYDCNPSRVPQCRIGRADITLPRNLGPLIGLTLHLGRLLLTDFRIRRGLPVPRGGLAGLIAALPVINLSLLDKGAYTNLLFPY